MFTKEISIIAYPDCSKTLVPNAFSPAQIKYNSSGSQKTIASSYEAIFAHTPNADCVLNTCSLKEKGCLTTIGMQSLV